MQINLEINSNNIQGSFERIAEEIMNGWLIEFGNSEYRIAEIEFYMKSYFHDDNYTHAHQLQKEKEKWYFHGAGIDLTFGSDDIYGGILIRAIYDIKKDKYIDGPLNSLTEVFSNIDSIYSTNLKFGMKKTDSELVYEKPISAPRVGLNPEGDSGMYKNFYRFLIMPKHKHAEKTKIAEGMRQNNYSADEIKGIFG